MNLKWFRFIIGLCYILSAVFVSITEPVPEWFWYLTLFILLIQTIVIFALESKESKKVEAI